MLPPDSALDAEATRQVQQCLEELGASSSGITLAVVTSEDGFEIAAYRGGAISGRIAAMSSSLEALAEAITREASLGKNRSLIIEAENGAVLVLGLDSTTPRASLSVVAQAGETLGQLLWAARNCCKSLERALQRQVTPV